jgi:hypothetical protein
MIKKNFVKNNLGIAPLRIFVIVFVIVAIICLLWYIWSISEISCDSENKIELLGTFRGFYSDPDYNGYTILVIGDSSFSFKRGLDKDYLTSLLTHNVSISACKRVTNSSYLPPVFYDFLSGVIVME